MKVKDFKVGQIVMDKLGNEYKVLHITDDNMPLRIACTKFCKPIAIYDGSFFYGVGQEFWIYKSKKVARKGSHQGIGIVTAKSLKLVKDVA